jgi:hypothetical protein
MADAQTPIEDTPVPSQDAPPKDSTVEKPEKTDPKDKNAKIVKVIDGGRESSKRMRKDHFQEWKRNVELRMGKIATMYTGGLDLDDDDLQTEINPDWALTKTKTANLFSQVPTVQGTHENLQYAPAVSPFMKQMNYEIGEKRAHVAVAMEEALNDVVNAAGIAGAIVGYAARFDMVDVPSVEVWQSPKGPIPVKAMTEDQQHALMDAGILPKQSVNRKVSDKFYVTRISPVDLLVPSDFTGSCFDDGDWVGRTGRLPWSVAKAEFKLSEEDKDNLLSGYDKPSADELRTDAEQSGLLETKGVKFDEIYYWRYRFDSDEKNFNAIWKVVFVEGKKDPVIHEPWDGQELDEKTRQYIGATVFPIRFLTLTYITDNPIPPSDSAAGRPQVNDLRRSRNQMFANRRRSMPLRWFDVNRVDPLIQANLMRGTIQGFIPFNGNGNNGIGEIARASYPAEDFTFDSMTKQDLMELWQIGPDQLGAASTGKKSTGQSQLQQQNFATRIGQERSRVAYFFLSICQVLAGLMVLHSDFPVLTGDEKAAMQKAWDNKHIIHDLVLKIRPDSTIVLDTQAQLQRYTQFLNLTAKSGFVNPEPIIAKMAELSGIDPAEVMIKPQGKPPDQPNISYRFSSKDDIINPVVFAILKKAGMAPSAEEIEEAKQLLMSSVAPPKPPAPQGAPGAGGAPPLPPGGAPPAPPAAPAGQPHPTDGAHPDWHLADKVAKRGRDIGPGGS